MPLFRNKNKPVIHTKNICLVVSFLSVVFPQLVVLGTEVSSVTDHPIFIIQGAPLLGPGASGITTSFRQDLIDHTNNDTVENIFQAGLDKQVANRRGDMVFICPQGQFPDALLSTCYSCPTGYNHNPLLPPSVPGVCFQITELRKADKFQNATLICPSGQFPDIISGKCYSCPAGFSHNPLLPAGVTGACSLTDNTTANFAHAIGCPSGQFDGLNGSCYSCPSGYSHNPAFPVSVPGVCYKSGYTENARMSKCGSRSCSDYWAGICWSYSYSGCADNKTSQYRSGNSYYKCSSGFAHNIFHSFNNSGICSKYRWPATSTASYSSPFKHCTSGEIDGLNGNCYSCPAGYNHNPLLTVGTAGVCSKIVNTIAQQQGDMTFICPTGSFIDISSGECRTCATGFDHNPLLPGDIPGVCFQADNLVANNEGSPQLFCPSGQFWDTVTNACYSCSDGYTWNPFSGVNEPGVCYKFALGSGDFNLGYTYSREFHNRFGIEGSFVINSGTVTIDYQPEVQISLESSYDSNFPNSEVFIIKTRQIENNTTLSLTTSSPELEMTFDAYLDFLARENIDLHYTEFTALGPIQHVESILIRDLNTVGEHPIAAEPITSFSINGSGMQLTFFGLGKDSYWGGFEPPLELKRNLVQTSPPLNISAGVVLLELGATIPDLDTPAADDFSGTKSTNQSITALAKDTFIEHSIASGSRTNLNFKPRFIRGANQSTDIARVDIDLDGFLSLLAQVSTGLLIEHGTGIPLVNWWSINTNLLDLDLGVIFSLREKIKFEPNLKVTLDFGRPVESETFPGSGIYAVVNQITINVGDNLTIIHPGGSLEVNPEYTIDDNLLTNDTDLMVEPIFEGEALTLKVKILGVPNNWLPKLAVSQITADIVPDPIKLADLSSEDVLAFSIPGFDYQTGSSNGFANQSGSPLAAVSILNPNNPPEARCKNVSVSLDANGQASIVAQDVDNGSFDTDANGVLSFAINQSAFSCDDLGVAPVTLNVTDSSGESASCTAYVTVEDNIYPTVYAGPDQLLEATATTGASTSLAYTSADNCASTAVITPVLSVYPLGITTVLVTASDPAGNFSTDSVNIEVQDTTPPVLTLPANISREATAPLTAINIGLATATDIFSVTIVSDAPAAYPVGITDVTWTATDSNANSSSGFQTITVVDTTPPELTVPANIVVTATGFYTPVDLGEAVATDLVGVTQGPTPSTTGPFEAGTTTITWTVSDAAGNVTRDTQTVEVLLAMSCNIDLNNESNNKKDKKEQSPKLTLASDNMDENQQLLWQNLFASIPDQEEKLQLQRDIYFNWLAGALRINGQVSLEIENEEDGLVAYQKIKVEISDDDDSQPMLMFSGGMKPAFNAKGRYAIVIDEISSASLSFEGTEVTGTIRKLTLLLDKDSDLNNPEIDEFELEFTSLSTLPEGETTVTEILIDVPETSIMVFAQTKFSEKDSEKPKQFNGQVIARLKESDDDKKDKDDDDEEDMVVITPVNLGIDPLSLDTNNAMLRKRVGVCTTTIPNTH